jgi:hypothetical protein
MAHTKIILCTQQDIVGSGSVLAPSGEVIKIPYLDWVAQQKEEACTKLTFMNGEVMIRVEKVICPKCRKLYCKSCCSKVGLAFKKPACPKCKAELVDVVKKLPSLQTVIVPSFKERQQMNETPKVNPDG